MRAGDVVRHCALLGSLALGPLLLSGCGDNKAPEPVAKAKVNAKRPLLESDRPVTDLLLGNPLESGEKLFAPNSVPVVTNPQTAEADPKKPRGGTDIGIAPPSSIQENGVLALKSGSPADPTTAAFALENDPFGLSASARSADASRLALSSERWGYLAKSERPEDVLLRTAVEQIKAGKLDDAIKSAEQLRNAEPNNARAYEMIAAIYNHQGKPEKALPFFDLAIRFDPDNAGLYMQRGMIYVQQKFTGRAVDDLSQVIKLQPKNLLPYLWRSLCYLNSGKFQLSVADSTVVLDHNNQVSDAYYLRCVARWQMGHRDKAKEDYFAAVKCGLDPRTRASLQPLFEPATPAVPATSAKR